MFYGTRAAGEVKNKQSKEQGSRVISALIKHPGSDLSSSLSGKHARSLAPPPRTAQCPCSCSKTHLITPTSALCSVKKRKENQDFTTVLSVNRP